MSDHKRDGAVAYGTLPVLKDSGERRQFKTGAIRDRAVGKGRFDLISTQMLFRLARHYEAGSIKYSDRNWEQGMPISVYVDAAMRHLIKYIAGWNDEDHLAAVVWNISAIMHHEDKFDHLQDLPDRIELVDDPWKWVIGRPEDA
jgi:hypothetical protein